MKQGCGNCGTQYAAKKTKCPTCGEKSLQHMKQLPGQQELQYKTGVVGTGSATTDPRRQRPL